MQSGWKHVARYVERACEETGISEGHRAIVGHPCGYLYSWCIWCSDAEITNGGFIAFYVSSTQEVVFSVIDGYERIGATEMAAVIKSSLYIIAEERPQYLRVAIPDSYFDGFVPVVSVFENLDEAYWIQKQKLPGNSDGTAVYLDCVIDHYFETMPNDFQVK